jgi:uncharacterized protein YjbI with pentapeptide repeats
VSKNRFALLIAATRYEDLPNLDSSGQDIRKLAAVLSDPTIGNFEVKELLNLPSHIVKQEIEHFFYDREPDDVLLLYISCHGIIDENNNLYFAMTDTSSKYPLSTAISADYINSVLNRSKSKRNITILDCAYSGRFLSQETDNLRQLTGPGKIILASSQAFQPSFATSKGSIFTNALLRGLETGEADSNADGLVTTDELYSYIYEHVTDEMPRQKPAFFSQEPVVFALNPRPTNLYKHRAEPDSEYLLKLLLEEKVTEYNRIREKDKSINVDFVEQNMDSKDLTGAHLQNANLARTSCQKTNLMRAYLKEANLEGANLRGAYLNEADLEGANLRGANLEGAVLTGANLRETNIGGANLREVELSNTDLAGANLRKADLSGKNLFGINLSGANLREANLEGAVLTGANFKGANIVGANLKYVAIEGTDIRTDLTRANLQKADLSNALLAAVDLTKSNLREAILTKSILTGAVLSGVDFMEAVLEYTDLRNADLCHAILIRADLRGANLEGASFIGTYLRDANLSYCSLSKAKFVGTTIPIDLSGVDFSHSTLRETIFIGTDIPIDLKDCKEADFDNAIIDSQELVSYLRNNNAKNVPYAITDNNMLKKIAKSRLLDVEKIYKLANKREASYNY